MTARQTPAVLVLLALLSSAALVAQRQRPDAPIEFIEIDAVVLDGKGRPLHGLTRADFTVKDAGKRVEVGTVTEVRAVPNDPDTARTVVALLDDTGVASVGTQSIQIIARALVSSASEVDDVPIVRLHAKDDEPYGDRLSGEERIRAYRGGAWPFAFWSVAGDVLTRVRDIATQIAANPSRRKIVVCVGSGLICNLGEPQPSAPRSFERLWFQAVSEAARANVSYYAIVPGRAGYRFSGLAEMTGGEVFATSYDVGPPIDRILQDAANYYVVGYFAAPSTGDRAHRVEVQVKAKGARVHARRLR